MDRPHKGFFISLEGPEGCGKTTYVPNLVEYLRKKGLVVFPTREPGGTSIGEQIRDVLHSLRNTGMHFRTETLLFQAARAQFVEEVIRPSLALGKIVLSDRYADSTLAYQGYGHQQDREMVFTLINYATNGLVPDLTILLDVDVELGLERKKRGQSEWNRMDGLPVEFHQRVRRGYLEMANANPQRWLVIDANRSIDEVTASLRNEVENKLIVNGFIEGGVRGERTR